MEQQQPIEFIDGKVAVDSGTSKKVEEAHLPINFVNYYYYYY